MWGGGGEEYNDKHKVGKVGPGTRDRGSLFIIRNEAFNRGILFSYPADAGILFSGYFFYIKKS